VTERGTTLATTDGGTTWTAQTTPAAKLPKKPWNIALLTRIACPSPTTCFAVGAKGAIVRWQK
jgi:photosystem II stability/assembly factor-like uncharacterized protein